MDEQYTVITLQRQLHEIILNRCDDMYMISCLSSFLGLKLIVKIILLHYHGVREAMISFTWLIHLMRESRLNSCLATVSMMLVKKNDQVIEIHRRINDMESMHGLGIFLLKESASIHQRRPLLHFD